MKSWAVPPSLVATRGRGGEWGVGGRLSSFGSDVKEHDPGKGPPFTHSNIKPLTLFSRNGDADTH